MSLTFYGLIFILIRFNERGSYFWNHMFIILTFICTRFYPQDEQLSHFSLCYNTRVINAEQNGSFIGPSGQLPVRGVLNCGCNCELLARYFTVPVTWSTTVFKTDRGYCLDVSLETVLIHSRMLQCTLETLSSSKIASIRLKRTNCNLSCTKSHSIQDSIHQLVSIVYYRRIKSGLVQVLESCKLFYHKLTLYSATRNTGN